MGERRRPAKALWVSVSPPCRSPAHSPAPLRRYPSPRARPVPAYLARSQCGRAPPGPGQARGRSRAAPRRRRAGRRSCGGPAAPGPPPPAAAERAPPVPRGAGPRGSLRWGSRRGSVGGGRPGGWRRPAPARGLRGSPLSPAPQRSRWMSWCQSRRLGSISPSHCARDARREGGAAASR